MPANDQFANKLIPVIGSAVFSLAVLVHFLRIYVTLEMIEESEWIRDRYFVRLSPSATTFEFWIRFFIVFIGSMSAVKILGLNVATPYFLPIYLAAFYITTIIWSWFMHRQTKIKVGQFLVTDITMLVGSVFLILVVYLDCRHPGNYVMVYGVTYLFLGLILAAGLLFDLIIKGGFYLYLGHLCLSGVSVRRGTIEYKEAKARLPKCLRKKYNRIAAKTRKGLDELLKKTDEKWQANRNPQGPRLAKTEQFSRERWGELNSKQPSTTICGEGTVDTNDAGNANGSVKQSAGVGQQRVKRPRGKRGGAKR